MEILIAILLIAMTVIFFLMRKGSKVEDEPFQDKKTQQKQKETVGENQKSKQEKIESVQPLDNKESLLNSFREVKDMRNLRFLEDGKTFIFCDEKRIIIGQVTDFSEKNVKFISKTVEADTISDLVYSKANNIVAVALKQSRDIIFYKITEDENKKLKLVKLEKYVKSTRKFGIKHLAISKCGTYLASSGSDQDTLIQIFDVNKASLIESIDTNEINNIDIKFSPCDNYLTVSTYMYEIAIMEFKRTIKFNKAINGDETTLKITRNRSVGGIKFPIVSYEFSNDSKYFIVSCNNGTLKILQNYDAIENSKVIQEFTVDKSTIEFADLSYLYVASSFNGKLKGYIACSNNRDIIVLNLEDGKVIKRFFKAHDTDIIGLKVVKNTNDQMVLVSGSRDGRFNVWKI